MRIGKIAGISCRFNLFLVIISIIYSFFGFYKEVLIVFAVILVHELAHIIMAIIMGIDIAEIEILPFGGQAKIEGLLGLEPEREIYVALAGPVISIMTAALVYLITARYPGNYHLYFVKVSLLLGLFNLLPALPLDGGRVIRAIGAKKIGYRKATQKAILMGKLISVMIVGYGIYITFVKFAGANFIFIGIFLFWAANREGAFMDYYYIRYLLNKKRELSRNGILEATPLVCTSQTKVKDILNKVKPAYYTIVVVLDDDHKILGMYPEGQLIECLLEKGPTVLLKDCQLG